MPIIPIISALTSIAPSIANWIGGDKAEEAATKISHIAKQVTGASDPQLAVSSILKDESKQLEFMKILDNNKTALDKAYLEDTQQARELHQHSIMPSVIVIMLTVMVFAATYGLFFLEIPEQNKDMAYIVFGALVAKWGDSIAYWVGSSRGSAEKDRLKR